jgi:hypothetical protein
MGCAVVGTLLHFPSLLLLLLLLLLMMMIITGGANPTSRQT